MDNAETSSEDGDFSIDHRALLLSKYRETLDDILKIMDAAYLTCTAGGSSYYPKFPGLLQRAKDLEDEIQQKLMINRSVCWSIKVNQESQPALLESTKQPVSIYKSLKIIPDEAKEQVVEGHPYREKVLLSPQFAPPNPSITPPYANSECEPSNESGQSDVMPSRAKTNPFSFTEVLSQPGSPPICATYSPKRIGRIESSPRRKGLESPKRNAGAKSSNQNFQFHPPRSQSRKFKERAIIPQRSVSMPPAQKRIKQKKKEKTERELCPRERCGYCPFGNNCVYKHLGESENNQLLNKTGFCSFFNSTLKCRNKKSCPRPHKCFNCKSSAHGFSSCIIKCTLSMSRRCRLGSNCPLPH